MIEFKRDPRFFRAVIRREKEDEDPAFSYFMMEDTFTNIKDKYDISRIEKFQITRKNYVVFGLITDLENITEFLKQNAQLIVLTFIRYTLKNINILKKMISRK